jgi:hypothetical protein
MPQPVTQNRGIWALGILSGSLRFSRDISKYCRECECERVKRVSVGLIGCWDFWGLVMIGAGGGKYLAV